jgi:predicted O-methyltransferase YrrM
MGNKAIHHVYSVLPWWSLPTKGGIITYDNALNSGQMSDEPIETSNHRLGSFSQHVSNLALSPSDKSIQFAR